MTTRRSDRRDNDPDETEGRALYRQRAQNTVFVEAFCAGDHRKVRYALPPHPIRGEIEQDA